MADSPDVETLRAQDVETLRAQLADLQQQQRDLLRRIGALSEDDTNGAWFSVTRTARLWGCSPSTVRRVAREHFRQFQKGGKNFLPRDVVLRCSPHKQSSTD